MGANIVGCSQSAHQADGSSPLRVMGETCLVFTRGGNKLYFDGLVIENLDTDVLAGIPFMERNDASIRPAKCQIAIGGDVTFSYGSS